MSSAKVYEFILQKLSLSPQHLDSLLARGIPEDEIKARGYKTWPYKRRALVQDCINAFGEDLIGVPGFWKDENERIQLSGISGIAIPIRSPQGEVVGIKLRPDNPANPSSKYVHLSSNPEPNKKTGEIKYPSGTAASVQVHFPFAKKKFAEGDDLRITEGELKADIATILSKTYTASVPGIGLWREAIQYIEELRPGRVIISYDADKSSQVGTYTDKPYEVGIHLAEFYTALKAMGVNALIEDWSPELGKGIDDVLADGHSDKVRFMDPDEADKFCSDTTGKSLGESADWVWIIAISKFVNVSTGQELSKDQYKDKYQYLNKKKCVVMRALNNPSFPRIDFPTYEPAKGKMLTREDGLTEFNYWRPSKVVAEGGDTGLFMDHCCYMLPDERERGILLDYLAWQIQMPGKKVHWALMLQGVQGTGKSYFGNLMRTLLGEHNVNTPSNEDIHEPYTAWQKNCQLIVIEELMARGRLELMNKLKPMITQPICTIREMYKPTYELPNHFNFLILTNHEDAIIIDQNDRRYAVLWSPAKPMSKDYYDDLWNWTSKNAGNILGYLLQRDLSNFGHTSHAPETAAKRELVRLSGTPLKTWIVDCIENEAWPFMGDVVSSTHLADCVPTYVKGASPNSISRTLKEIGCLQMEQVRLESGGKVRPWCVRRKEIWSSTDGSTVANEIERWKSDREPGGNPLLDAKPM